MEESEDFDEEVKQQPNNRPWLFKKGQSGNPKGRPPGKSLKERAKAMLNAMTPEQEQEFLNGIDKRTIWEMAEGKADTKTDVTSLGEKLNAGVVILPAKNEDTVGTTTETIPSPS